jgi:spore coat polysaccharide biosynthesis protein SpsF (cytidylyltransferase family)
LRVTGDAPLIDPGLIDYLVYTMVKAGADLCSSRPALCAP